MGNLVWHEYSRYVALTASIYTVWAGFFGLFYRKFFWDFVGGTMRNPGGLQAPSSSAVFVTVIVIVPAIQISAIVMGIIMIALDYPAPFVKGTRIHRTIALRIPLLLIQAGLAVLFYQGTNGALWSILAALAYTRAAALGEKMGGTSDKEGTKGTV